MTKELLQPSQEEGAEIPDQEVAPGMWLRHQGTDRECVQVILPWAKFESVSDERAELRFSILHSIDAGSLDPEIVFDLVANQVDAILVLRIWSDLVQEKGAPLPETGSPQLSKMVDLASQGRLSLLPKSVPSKD